VRIAPSRVSTGSKTVVYGPGEARVTVRAITCLKGYVGPIRGLVARCEQGRVNPKPLVHIGGIHGITKIGRVRVNGRSKEARVVLLAVVIHGSILKGLKEKPP
jgi:hypothetical protein